MNEIEFERAARRAASNIRAEAERISDSPTALASLLASEPTTVDTSRSVVVGYERQRRLRRSPWIPILIAASTVAAVAGVVLVATRGDDGTLVVTTEPTQPGDDMTEPSAPEPSAPEPSAPEPNTDPDITLPQLPPAPNTLPNNAHQGGFEPFSFEVPDDIGEPLARAVLLTADAGSGQFDLGWEDCQECEPLRPWAPVVDAAGTIYIADVVNSRWRVHGLGQSRNIPFPDGEVVAGSPVIGPDGLLYAPVAAELQYNSPRRIIAYDPQTFDEVASYPAGTTNADGLELVNGVLQLGATVITSFDLPLGTPTIDIDHDAGLVTISLSGTQREFRFPENWLISGRDAVPIDGGSTVVRVLAPTPSDDSRFELVLVRLWLDGSTSAGIIDNDSTINSAIQITSDGLVQLEGTSVVRYDLPAG